MSLWNSLEEAASVTNSSNDEDANSELRYRVSVCLQNYFSDERARCYVMVCKRRRVRWLERKLKDLFALRGGFWLRSRGHLLPSAETLAILNPDDPVEVVPLVDNTDSKQVSKVQNTRKLKGIGDNKIPIQRKDTTVYNTPSVQEASCLQAECVPLESKINDSPSHQNCNLENLKKQALAMLDEKYCETNGDFEQTESKVGEVNNEENNYGLECPARKRRRVRRRKRISKLQENNDAEVSLECEPRLGDIVQRNRSASPRAPRLVHSTL